MPQISLLPAGTTPVGTEYFPAVQGVVTSRFTLNQVYTATKTLTGTTYDTAATGNSFSINGLAATSNTGTGAVVRATGPTMGAVTATSINKYTFTAPATAATLTILDGKTATINNSITFAGTDATTMTFPTTSATLARTDAANSFAGIQTLSSATASTTSGTGALVVAGGVGIGGRINMAGQLGVSIDGSAVTALTITDTAASGVAWLFGPRVGSGSADSFALCYSTNGASINVKASDSSVTLASTVASTTTATGALVVAGGVGVAGAITAGGAINSASSIKSSSVSAGIGYATGAGATGTQGTSKSTTTTLSPAAAVCGAVTMNAAALAAATIVSFTLTNTSIAVTDVLVLNHISGGTIGAYTLNAQCAAGSATINVRNNTAGSLSEAIVIQFVVIKAVNA